MAFSVRETLRRIIPWALESNSTKLEYMDNHKGVRGRIGIVGGARDYAGAPYFASMAAMRLGADLAYVICSSGASASIKSYSPDLIVTPLLDCPSEKDFSTEMDCLLSRLHTLVIGPGLGREKLLQSRARLLIEKAKARSLHLVLDADSLMMIYENPQVIKSYPNALLTPNRIELQRMLNSLYSPKSFDLKAITNPELEKLVTQCSTDLDVTILAKGMIDVISKGSSGVNMVSSSSGANRRCGGQGDILAGLAGTYLHWIGQANKISETNKIEQPTVVAGYLAAVTTRLCNELAYKDRHNGMLASDMIDKVHIALDTLIGDEETIKPSTSQDDRPTKFRYSGIMSQDEIKRYSRQMIMDEFGPERQARLKQSSAVIIGAGGLGCPVAVYLGAGGLGRMGIIDDDKVESSNLHRQILHNLEKVGMLKTDSVKQAIISINPNVQVDTHSVRMTRENAVQLIEGYDLVIDATDNLLTRYLISDACVVAKKPLISGAALKMDGQLTVYNYNNDTPCFRCLFPVPPPANAVGSCSDNGVLGVIPGVIGTLQALEALKISAGLQPSYAGKMLLFDGQLGIFRLVKLSKRRPDCEACGSKSKLDRALIDYEEFCSHLEPCQQKSPTNDILKCDERVSVEQYRSILESGSAHLLLDVRPKAHSDVSRLANAIQIPLVDLMNTPDESMKLIKTQLIEKATDRIYVVCRRGIASQRATRVIQELGRDMSIELIVMDIVGGMTAWARQIDSSYSCL